MCSRPKIVQADPPPPPPPPPTEVAVQKKPRKKDKARRGKGIGSLIIRRPTVNTGGSGGSGSNMNY